jgi:ABC-type transport system involved in multi-copper enzyme maturation permease subunit
MSTPTVAARPGTFTSVQRPQADFAELCRLALRQHRTGIVWAAVCYLGLGLLLLYRQPIPVSYNFAIHPEQIVPGLAGVIAVFWGAPLIATEYERRTNVFAWSQDATPTRWLLAKITVLGGLVVVMTVLVTLAQQQFVGNFLPYDWENFEASIPLALGYAAFGFTLGIAVGALWRRVVPAMATTLVVFAGIRFLIGLYLRPELFAQLITPLRWIAPISSPSNVPDAAALWLNYTYLNAAGQPVPYPGDAFNNMGETTQDAYVRIMHQHGVWQNAIDYQPASRVPVFQLAELAIFLVLTAIAVWIAFRAIRRA